MLPLKIYYIKLFLIFALNNFDDLVDKLHLQTDASSQVHRFGAAVVLLVLWRAVAAGIASLTIKAVASLARAQRVVAVGEGVAPFRAQLI